MNSPRTKLAALACAVAVPAALVAGCGGVPGNAVATVDGNEITKSEFNHWMNVAAKAGGQQQAAIPQPPDFEACIAEKRKTLPKPAKGQPKTTDAQLKDQCKQQYEALRDQVLQLLISYEWIQGEAEEQGIEVSDEEVRKQFETQKKASFPKEADYQKFLKDSGQSEEDILKRVRLDLLSNKIREKVTKGKDKVTDAELKKYYEENKERFARPEQRDLQVVLTKTEAKAREAKQAIQDGQKWSQVAKKFSIDQASKAQGGKLSAVAQGQQEKALDEAVFKADKGELVGPVKTQFGYYVFRVTDVTEASQQTLEQAKESIRQLLASQKQQEALDSFVKDFQKEWKEKTECRDGYRTQDCSNAPKATPTPDSAVPQPPSQTQAPN